MCSYELIFWLGFIFILRKDFNISLTSLSVCDYDAIYFNNNQFSLKYNLMNQKPTPNCLFWSTTRRKSNLGPPLRSLKKFYESLPTSQSKPSGLNMIIWKKHNYSPNQKQKRLKLQNETIKYRLAQENTEERKTLRRTKSKTEPDQPFLAIYKDQFARIQKKQVTTSLMSEEQEEVFANIKQESVQQEFKRNHKDVWKFIIDKKYPSEQNAFSNLRQAKQKKANTQMQQMKSKLFKQKMKAYMKKWNPKCSQKKPLFHSMTTAFKPIISKSTTINL